MSGVIQTVIPARTRVLGGHEIRRLLPSSQRRMVGPFIFFDHIGPERLEPGKGVDVAAHPHVHLATVTYLFEGELDHRDSLGTLQTIRPGDINWMHAGTGIVHSERSGPRSRESDSGIHGIQLWVALPQDQEETAPAFTHYPGADFPSWNSAGVTTRILVGSANGCGSPVQTSSPTIYMDVGMEAGRTTCLPSDYTDRCIYIVSGGVRVDGRRFGESEMIVFEPDSDATVEATDRTRLVVLGGEPLDGERHIWWNFVSSSKERIEQAKRDWHENRFPGIRGDDHDDDDNERMPLPE
jgi:redox-sensitive bicupin YhaK (pirin superfamily)